jgi:hypothetical protein
MRGNEDLDSDALFRRHSMPALRAQIYFPASTWSARFGSKFFTVEVQVRATSEQIRDIQ